jgi:chromosome segregation ATPase
MEIEAIRKQVSLELGMGYRDHTAADWAQRCKFLLGELDSTLLKLDASDQRNTILEVENTKLNERLAGARQGRDDALSRLHTADERIKALEATHEHHAERTRAAESRLGSVMTVLDRLYKNQITRDADAIGEISELFSDEEIARAVEKPFLNQESET